MQTILLRVSLLCLLASACAGQSSPADTSLCLLQESIRDGEHETVRVAAVFSVGPEHELLDDAACPEESTWAERELQSERNKKKLNRLLEHWGKAYVVLEGEFYGPPLPDPKLPEKIREVYHPRWGHLGCCRTKLIVHVIRRVEEAPVESSTQGSPNEQ